MSYSDFEKGISKPPFCQRIKQQKAQADYAMLAQFKESERRLNILRTATGDEHAPTPEEIKRWIASVKKT